MLASALSLLPNAAPVTSEVCLDVIASEAKQSREAKRSRIMCATLDCFVAFGSSQ